MVFKIFEKFSSKCLQVRKKSLPLHPRLRQNDRFFQKQLLLVLRAILRMKCRRFRSNAKFLKKKVAKSFGVSKIFFTFAAAFEKNENGSSIGREFATNGLLANDAESWIDARFLKKSCRKVCKFKKLALPLQSRSSHKRRTVFKLVL